MPRMRSITTLTLAAALLILPGSLVAQGTSDRSDGPDIETVGSGERRIPPDRATVMLLVESKAAGAATAAASNAKTVAAVRDTLRRLGLDSASTTASYNVGPDFEHGDRDGPRRVGY